jgi:pilus assembly protein FimV
MGKMTSNAPKPSKLKTLSAAVLIACSLPSHALTLGKFQVQSAMGEPLRAEVEIAQITPDELRDLQTQIAPPTSFQQAGMEFNAALHGVTTRIETRADGRTVIILTGRNPVQDSFIDLIVEAKSATGKVVKNYALLLNTASSSIARVAATPVRSTAQPEIISSPAVTTSGSPEAVASPSPRSVELNSNQVPVYRFGHPQASSTTTPTTPTTNDRQSPVPVAVISSATMAKNAAAHANEEALQVNPGDTVSNLMMGRMPPGVTLDQMMLALVRANPHAFIEGNINLVRSGSVLRMPKANEATQISRDQARETVLSQNRDFAAYARRVAQTPILVGSTQNREMSGNVSQSEPSAPASGPKQDKLTLSKALTGPHNEEAKLAADRESKDATAQLDALKKNMEDLEALAKNKPTDSSVSLQSPIRNDDGLLEKLGQDKSIWAWALGALLALVALVVWSRRGGQRSQGIYAPSYDDVPPASASAAETMIRVPPQMANIDLELPTVVDPKVSTPTNNTQADQNKLHLAGQLIANGEKDLARSLIMSVTSNASGDLKARAMQMLGQIA